MRQFTWTALEQDFPDVEESSANGVENLRSEKLSKKSRNRTHKHRSAKRYRPKKIDLSVQNFPYLSPPTQVVESDQNMIEKDDVVQISKMVSKLPQSYKDVTVEKINVATPIVPIMPKQQQQINESMAQLSNLERLISSPLPISISQAKKIRKIDHFLPRNRFSISSYFKEKKSRISSIKRSSSVPMTKKEILKLSSPSNQKIVLAPSWQRLKFQLVPQQTSLSC